MGLGAAGVAAGSAPGGLGPLSSMVRFATEVTTKMFEALKRVFSIDQLFTLLKLADTADIS